MAQKPSADKTEQPTQKKREESRKKGMAARSSELPPALSLVVAAVMLPTLAPQLLERMAVGWSAAVSPDSMRDPDVALSLFGAMLGDSLMVFVPLVLLTAGTSVVAQLALTGGRPNLHKLKPQWSNLNPAKGFKRLFSLQVAWDFGRTLTKLVMLSALTWGLYNQSVDRAVGGARPLTESLGGTGELLADLLVRAALAAFIVGIADAVFNKRRFLNQIRMTKQEVKEESKQSEGNPLVKSEIRRRQQQFSRNRMIAAVARADVIVTNPTHIAVALAYNATDGAPRVLAKGAGPVADRIREEGRKHGIPIRENKLLARAIFRSVDVDQLIPAEFFAAVAAVLAAVYRARSRR